MTGTGIHGVSHSFNLCSLCCIEMLKRLDYAVTEPEKQTLKESDWVLDELPEIEK